MKKTHMIFYSTSVVGFYISLVLLYLNTASVAGTALLCMSILMLGLGVFAQWKSASKDGFFADCRESACVSSETAHVSASC